MNTRIVALSIALSLSVAGAGCKEEAKAQPPNDESVTVLASPGPSIYPLGVPLRDQDGAAIDAGVFRGSPVIVSMFFGSCPAACPLLVTQIKRVESSLAPEDRANLRVLLVSFDAERDTPEALRELARAHKADVSRWRFASADDEHARVLGNALGISFRKIENGMFAHDSVISLLDAEGRVVARTDDPSAAVAPLGAAIARLSRRAE